MIVEITITEIIPHVYVGACLLPGGKLAHTSVEATSKTDAIKAIKQRIHSQRSWFKRQGQCRWDPYQDKFEIKFIKKPQPNLFDNQEQETKPANAEPAIYELITNKTEDGATTFSVKQHERPLMTATELKMVMFAKSLNNN